MVGFGDTPLGPFTAHSPVVLSSRGALHNIKKSPAFAAGPFVLRGCYERLAAAVVTASTTTTTATGRARSGVGARRRIGTRCRICARRCVRSCCEGSGTRHRCRRVRALHWRLVRVTRCECGQRTRLVRHAVRACHGFGTRYRFGRRDAIRYRSSDAIRCGSSDAVGIRSGDAGRCRRYVSGIDVTNHGLSCRGDRRADRDGVVCDRRNRAFGCGGTDCGSWCD